jgi:glutaredoxin
MHITVYTKPNCNFCEEFKTTARNLNLRFEEKRLGVHFAREHLKELYPSAETYPVVVVDGYYIGGFTEFKNMIEQTENRVSSTQIMLNEG